MKKTFFLIVIFSLIALCLVSCSCEHSIIEIPAVPATETYHGSTAGQKCSICDEILIAPEIAHYEEIQIEKDSTCLEEGLANYFCSICDEFIRTETIELKEHRFRPYKTVDKKATCAEEGSESRHCKDCDSITDITTIPITHEFSYEWIIDKECTCTEAGSKHKVCVLCGESSESTEIPAAHKFPEAWNVIKQNNCTENGMEESYCLFCSEKVSIETTALGHEWHDATCTTPKTCSRCNLQESEALGHTTKSGVCERCNLNMAELKNAEIAEENKRHQNLINNINSTYKAKISTKQSLIDKLASTYGIYSVGSVSYHQSRINSLQKQYSNIYAQMLYASSYQQISLQRQLESIQEDITYETACVYIAEYLEEIENFEWEWSLYIDAENKLHQENLGIIEAKYS